MLNKFGFKNTIFLLILIICSGCSVGLNKSVSLLDERYEKLFQESGSLEFEMDNKIQLITIPDLPTVIRLRASDMDLDRVFSVCISENQDLNLNQDLLENTDYEYNNNTLKMYLKLPFVYFVKNRFYLNISIHGFKDNKVINVDKRIMFLWYPETGGENTGIEYFYEKLDSANFKKIKNKDKLRENLKKDMESLNLKRVKFSYLEYLRSLVR